MNPYANHLEERAYAASALELVCMLYDALMQSVDEARLCLAREDRAGRAAAISRAQLVLGELSAVLDMERGGEIARRLKPLYAYLIDRLNEANCRQSPEPLAEVKRLVAPLAEAWRELGGGPGPMAPGHPVYSGAEPVPAGAVSFCV
jgi:flagellar protein FliS